MNHRFAFNYRRKMIVAIALIAAMLAATAVAVVQGNLLRTLMEESAGAAFANQVQDVHISGGSDFSFTVDEILCEGDKMYLSYSVSVPDDGNTYLYALYKPTLNGKSLSGSYAYFYDEPGMPLIHAIGGEFGTSRSAVLQDIIVDAESLTQENNLLDMQAVFFKANHALQYVGDREQYNALMKEHIIAEDENGSCETTWLLPDTDTLYCFGKEAGSESATVYLEFHPSYWKNWRKIKQQNMDQEVLTPEEFAATGIAEFADSVSLSIPLVPAEAAQAEYNDVARRIFEMDGFALEITDFRMNHLGASYKAEIRTGGEIPREYTGDEPYARFYALLRADGTELNNGQGSTIGSGGLSIKQDGTGVYLIDQDIRGIIPVEEIDSLLLAPQLFAEDGEFIGYDLGKAISIKPVYNPDKPESTPIPSEDPAATDDLSS